MLYGITILVCMAVIIAVNWALNSLLFSLPVWYIFVAVVASTVAVIAVDGLFAFLIRRLPEKWFSHEKKIFDVGKKECKFYEKLGIRKWKDKVLELGNFTDFHKDKVYDPTNNEYIERFLLEANYGEIIHLVGVFLGFLIIFIFPLRYALCFGVPVGIVNAVLNLMPYFILRYNTPRLKLLHKRNLRTQSMRENPLPSVA